MGTSTANVVEILALLILLQSVSSFCNGDNFNGSCIKTEREALVKFKSSLLNNSNSLPSWVGDDCCRWDGVTCDDINGHVVELVLSWASIMGNISLHLGNLSNLQYLDLSMKPSLAIHSLHFPSSLKYLNLSYVLLDKCDNWLQSINMLPSLLELDLWNCELSIIADVSHVNFTSLEVLNLGWNNFHSTIPRWLYNITKLQNLVLHSGPFRGSLSTDISNLKSLASLDADFNSLEGNIPNTLNRLCNLIELYLGYNKFSDISNNLLHGQIPQNLSEMMPSLQLLSLSNNYLNGTVPATLCRSGSLQILDLSNNHLSGRIPSCWGNLPSLTVIDFSSNMLSGDVPMSLGSQESLVSLHLQNNTLQGKIPMSLRNLESLETLDFSMNAFDGFIPSWIGESLSSLKVLSIHSNKFEGEIPLQLCYLASLRILNLANNMMTGTIPNCFGNFTAIAMHEQKGHWDYYTKYEPFAFVTASYGENVQVYVKGIELEYTRTLRFLYSIDLSGNNFVGEIPQELMNLSGLQILNLSTNKLDGHIPWNIGKLSSLESLDLSENELSGSIPFSISDLNFLSHLNLSLNHLSGRIPKGNQLQTLDDKSIYIGNDGLCGPPLNNCSDDADELPKGHEKGGTRRKDDSEIVWFYGGMGMGFAAGFVGVCSILYFNDSRRCAWFGLVDRVYNKLWVTIAIKANQVKRKFLRNKLEGNA
ncbi:receptor-like protein EIX2 isoform X3 [Manihot esculenta]|uniref:receptor-like protein EIX2 isoform X3 n=1 Tax=Manihot esculenta TaxID=3983 RepID=UPI000B5D7FFC|nr:receptor-like protein EIX2 isoform X3 [Manihot esculenta]